MSERMERARTYLRVLIGENVTPDDEVSVEPNPAYPNRLLGRLSIRNFPHHPTWICAEEVLGMLEDTYTAMAQVRGYNAQLVDVVQRLTAQLRAERERNNGAD